MCHCDTCKHEATPAHREPCDSCIEEPYGRRSGSNWEPKACCKTRLRHESYGQYGFRGGVQPIEFIRSNRMNFIEGNIIKYIYRYPMKGGVGDLMKARAYLDWLIADQEDLEDQGDLKDQEDLEDQEEEGGKE